MGGINLGRVILGGLAAGIVINIGETIGNMFVFAELMESMLADFGLDEPGMAGIIVFLVVGFALGIAITWLYASIRPRYGAGPKTAVCAGLFAWALYMLLPTLVVVSMGLFTLGAMIGPTIYALVEFSLAAVVGGAVYKEE